MRLNKNHTLATLCGIVLVGTLIPNSAESQLGYIAGIRLQSTTPGTADTGHGHISGTMRAGQFVGSGAGVTGIDAGNLSSGTIPDARLSANVARRDQANTFAAGPNQFNGFLGVGRSTQVTSAESFGIGNNSASFDGMYIKTAANGLPFYGYSLGGAVSAYSYVDGNDSGIWKLNVGGLDRLLVNPVGFVGVGRKDQVTSNEIFGIGNNASGASGMYVKTSSSGLPFYGYSVGGGATAYHLIDSGDSGKWKFFLGGDYRMTLDVIGNLGLGTTNPVSKLDVLAAFPQYGARLVNANAAANSAGLYANGSSYGGVFESTSATSSAIKASGPDTAGEFLSTGTGVALRAGANSSQNHAIVARSQGGSSVFGEFGTVYAVSNGDGTFNAAIYGRSTTDFGAAIVGNAGRPEGLGGGLFIGAAGSFWAFQNPGGVGVLGSGLGAETSNPDAFGVVAVGAGSGANVAIRGSGNFQATGTKSFIIDHPFDPENKTLKHFCSEGPEPTNVYSGTAICGADGSVTVNLPDYFESINKDFRYQLTCIGGYSQVYVASKVQNNRFQIAGGKPGLEVSWQVTGTRNDAYVQHHGYKVEDEKPVAERGFYLSPEAYGLPQTRSTSMTMKIIKNADGTMWDRGRYIRASQARRK